MHPDTREEIVSRLRAVVDQKPHQAMDEVESLLRCSSVCELAEILSAVYVEISEEIGIDWHFTAMQWKLGNRGREELREISQQARFMVWSLAFKGGATPVPKRDTPPICHFPSSQSGHLTARGQHAPKPRLDQISVSENTHKEGKTRGSGGRYRI